MRISNRVPPSIKIILDAYTPITDPAALAAVIYLRISQDPKKDDLAHARQIEDSLKMIKEKGWRLVAVYCDTVGASDKRKKRPDYSLMITDYQAGTFDGMVAYDLDRIMRQPRELEDLIDLAEDQGLKVITANGEADLTTDGGRMFARMKVTVAKAEMERKSARQKRANIQRRERGLMAQGPRSFGYESDGSVNDLEAPYVIKMFDMFTAGESIRQISRVFNDAKIPTRYGAAWNPTTVRTILINPRYCGRLTHQGTMIRIGDWTPLVSEETFDHAQAILTDPRRVTNGGLRERKNLCSGIIRCGVCNAFLMGWAGNRYGCRAGHLTRKLATVDEAVLAVVTERLADPDLHNILPNRIDVAPIMAELRELNARLRNVENDYDADLIDARRYKIKSDKINAMITTTEARLPRTTTGPTNVIMSDDPVAEFNRSSLMIKQAVISTLVEVTLYPVPRGSRGKHLDKIKITFR